MTCLTTLLISPARQADVFAGGANPLHDRVNTICPGEGFSEGPWRAGAGSVEVGTCPGSSLPLYSME